MWSLPKSFHPGTISPDERIAEIKAQVGPAIAELYAAFRFGEEQNFADRLTEMNGSMKESAHNAWEQAAQRLLDAHVLNSASYQEFRFFADRVMSRLAPQAWDIDMGTQAEPGMR